MSTDWMPRTRQGKLDRADMWLRVLAEMAEGPDGKAVVKWSLWGVREQHMATLGELHGAASAVLLLAKDKETRTEVVTRQVEDAFTALETFMRQMRLMYFHVPPLTNADMVSLGFTVRDEKLTPKGDPTATVAGRAALGGGYGELDFYIEAVSGDLNARENEGPVYLTWLVVPPGGPAPTSPKELTTDHLSTKRKKERLRFGIDKSGWDVYICARIEEGDRKGEWGPIVKAKIP